MSERKPTPRQRQAVKERAEWHCEYCLSREDFSPAPFSVEHVQPRSQGGTNRLDNLAYSCQACNNHKYTLVEALDPGSGQTVPLYHPRRDRWEEHFAWSEDFRFLLGKTPTGRATVLRLDLNRQSVLNLRRVFRRDGKHTPIMRRALEDGYRRMAADEEREAEALEWSEATIGDVADEPH